MKPDEGYLTTDDGVRLFFRRLGDGPKTAIIPNGFYLADDIHTILDGWAVLSYDPRNRGRSDTVSDPSKLAEGIHNDVNDLEAVRRHLGIDQVDVIGHSYVGLTVILYAMKYPNHVNRLVQIAPMPPHAGQRYPAHLTYSDATLAEISAKLGQLQKERESTDPVEFCKKFWGILRKIYIVNPADAGKIDWGRCELANERNFMKYWSESIAPSIANLNLTSEEVAKARAPVLTIHGMKDRSAPYGGGREWALLLPNARLVTVKQAGHAPWIEGPEVVFGSIQAFLGGEWPKEAESVTSL